MQFERKFIEELCMLLQIENTRSYCTIPPTEEMGCKNGDEIVRYAGKERIKRP